MSGGHGVIPWVRTLTAVPLCIVAFNAIHTVGALLTPDAYQPLLLDRQRLCLLLYIMLAGIVATFVLVAVSRHRAGLHACVLATIGLAVDLSAVLSEFRDQPLWFRALVIALVPLQAAAGMHLGRMSWRLWARARE